MIDTNIYNDIAQRTGGAFLIGVVGPVRTGKSTFIKRFMESMVIPEIDNSYTRERAKDELPQSGSGRTIMTAEPKFVPEEAVDITVGEGTKLSVRLVDCVGYMVDGAAGQFEDGQERMVATPWFDHEVTLTDAAEKGTHKVITEHSTIGVLMTTDGSICDIPREKYVQPEERVVRELKSIGKPFVIILNCREPDSEQAKTLAKELSEKYSVGCMALNCLEIDERDFTKVINSVLEEFPLKAVAVELPDWAEALPDDSELKKSLFDDIYESFSDASRVSDSALAAKTLSSLDYVGSAQINGKELGSGIVSVEIKLPKELYYEIISKETGLEVGSDGEVISILTELSEMKKDYDRIKEALDSVRATGYGVVMPDSSQMQLHEPQIVRQGGKYSVKMKASAPAIHMLMTDIETEVTPAIGGETASEEIMSFLLQGFDGDVNRIWESNIFGKSLNDIAEEGLAAKINSLPENARKRLKDTIQRLINEGSGNLICILF